MFTLGQAAKAVGRSKSALSRDIKAGRVSAGRNSDGSLAIEPSELFRVFPPLSHDNTPWDDRKPLGNGGGTGETPAPRITDSALRERLARAEAERDLLRDLVSDLRQQRDREAEERRRLTAVLADLRGNGAADSATMVAPAPAPSSAWQRFLKWRRGQ